MREATVRATLGRCANDWDVRDRAAPGSSPRVRKRDMASFDPIRIALPAGLRDQTPVAG